MSKPLFQSTISRRDFLRIAGGAAAGAAAFASGLPAFAQAEVNTEMTGQIVLSLLGSGPSDTTPLTDLAAAYNALRPNVEIVWEYPGSSAGDYPTWLGTQVSSENIRPDVVSGNYFPNFAGYLNFDQYRYLTNPHTGRNWDEDLDWNFFVARNEKLERYMLPTRAVHINWFYNVDMFEQAGVTPPTNWDEFAEVCAKLAETFPDVAPVVANYIWQVPQWFAEVAFDQYHIDWVEKVRAQPGDWNYNPDIDGTFTYDPTDPDIHNKYTLSNQRMWKGFRDGELRFDTPEVAEIIANTGKIFPKYAVSDFFTIADPYPRFIAGQAAIMYNGTWALSTLKNDSEAMTAERLEELGLTGTEIQQFKWATFEQPSMEGPLVKTTAKTVESATGEYISIIVKDQAQTDLTLDFIQWWISKAGYQTWVDGLFATGQTFSGPLKVNDVSDPPEVAELWKDIQWKGNAEASYNGFITGMVGGDYLTSARNIWKAGLEGSTTPEEAAAALQKYLMDNFDAMLEVAGLTQEDLDNPARQPGT